MGMTLRVATAAGLLAIPVLIWLWLSPESADYTGSATVPAAGEPAVDGFDLPNPASPFELSDAPTRNRQPHASVRQAVRVPEAEAPASLHPLPAIDVTRLDRAMLSDAAFDALVVRLRAEPDLLQQFIEEFRQEQDPDRQDFLMRLLGDVGGTEVALLASELIYSGNEQSRLLGLRMLQRAQPGSEEVGQIASSLLTTEVEPAVLMDTLATLARPGTVDTENRALLADQVALMATHTDPRVRGVSLDILSRLSTDGRDTPVLLAGLEDASPRVRESAAYALVGHEQVGSGVTGPLWQLLRNPAEPRSTRAAALLALRSLSPTDGQKGELSAIERALNTINRRQ